MKIKVMHFVCALFGVWVLFGCAQSNQSSKGSAKEVAKVTEVNMTFEELKVEFEEQSIEAKELVMEGMAHNFKLRVAISLKKLHVFSLEVKNSDSMTYMIDEDTRQIRLVRAPLLFDKEVKVIESKTYNGNWKYLEGFLERLHFDNIFRCRSSNLHDHYARLTPKSTKLVTLSSYLSAAGLPNYMSTQSFMRSQRVFTAFVAINYASPSLVSLGIDIDYEHEFDFEPSYESIKTISFVGPDSDYMGAASRFREECDKIYEMLGDNGPRMPFKPELDRLASIELDKIYKNAKVLPYSYANYVSTEVFVSKVRNRTNQFDTIMTDSETEAYEQRVIKAGGKL